jgi:hypothetical protein
MTAIQKPTQILTLALTLASLFLFMAVAPPSSAQIGVVGALSRSMALTPGEEAQGRVIVRNDTDQARVVRAYLTDYQRSADGTTTYGEAGGQDRSNASWVHIVPAEQTIFPNGTASFNFLVRVPEDPALSGTYWSMLMVEPVSPSALEPPPEGKNGEVRISVGTTVRTGIHLITQIQGTGRADLKFLDRALDRKEGRVFLRLDIENTGERHLGLGIWAELFDEEGYSIGRFDAPRQGLFPKNSARIRVPLSGVPSGTYQALVVADDGGDNVFGARYEIVIP